MKKQTIALLLAMLMVISCLAGCGSTAEKQPGAETEPEVTEAPAVTDSDISGGFSFDWDNFKAVYESHSPDTVVLRINDTEITWEQFYYRLFQIVDQFAYYKQDGWDWDEKLDDQYTVQEYTRQNIEQAVAQYAIIIEKAAENGVTLSDEGREQIDELYAQNLEQMGEGDEGKFAEALMELYLTPEGYRWMLETSALYTDLFVDFYGADGENLTEEEVQDYISDVGVMHCKHILFLTMDMATGEGLDEAAKAEKLAAAEETLAKLKEVEDDPEALEALFTELMNENSEDTGLAAYPDGYFFGPGEMVTEFEEGTRALDNYGLSDVVETSYGYHIILRLPITGDTMVDGENTMRLIAASRRFEGMTTQWFTDYTVTYEPEFENMDFTVMFPTK